jgi:hypothetical protein
MLLIMTVDVVVAVGVGGSEGGRTESCLGRMDRDASLIRTNLESSYINSASLPKSMTL